MVVIAGTHDTTLVILSILVAVVTAYDVEGLAALPYAFDCHALRCQAEAAIRHR